MYIHNWVPKSGKYAEILDMPLAHGQPYRDVTWRNIVVYGDYLSILLTIFLSSSSVCLTVCVCLSVCLSVCLFFFSLSFLQFLPVQSNLWQVPWGTTMCPRQVVQQTGRQAGQCWLSMSKTILSLISEIACAWFLDASSHLNKRSGLSIGQSEYHPKRYHDHCHCHHHRSHYHHHHHLHHHYYLTHSGTPHKLVYKCMHKCTHKCTQARTHGHIHTCAHTRTGSCWKAYRISFLMKPTPALSL